MQYNCILVKHMMLLSANIRHWKYYSCLKTVQATETQWKTYTREAGSNYAISNFCETGLSRSLATAPLATLKAWTIQDSGLKLPL